MLLKILFVLEIICGVALAYIGYSIYFKKEFTLIKNFEGDYNSGARTKKSALRLGLIDLLGGISFIAVGIISFFVQSTQAWLLFDAAGILFLLFWKFNPMK